MLKRPQLLILSGQAGAGTTSAARGLCESLVGHGVGAVAVDGRAKHDELVAMLDRAAESAGLGSRAQDVLRSLVRLDGLAGALASSEAAEKAESVVWDAGEIDGFIRLLTLLGLSRSELAAMVPPLAATRIAQALPEGDRVAWLRTIDAIEAVRSMLANGSARIFLALLPDDGLEERLATRMGQLALVGSACDGIIVNQVPAGSDGWPEPWAGRRRQHLDRIRECGVPVVSVPFLADPAPAFRDAAGELLAIGPAPRPLSDRVTERADGGFDLHVHLPGVRAGEVRAGRLDDSLVIEVGGMRRSAALMPMLRRCEIEGAGMREGWLIVRFSRNQALWPEAS